MKIAVVTPDLPHYRRNLYREMAKVPGVQTVHYSDEREHDLILPVDTRELREFHGLRNVNLGPFFWQRGAISVALRKDIDRYLITGDVKCLSTWVVAALVRLRRKPLCFWTIGWHRPEAGLKRLFRLAFYRLADRVLVYGNVGKRIGVMLGFPEDRMEVVYNSVTGLDEVSPVKLPAKPQEYAVGAIVRLNGVKRLDLLLKAVAVLNARGMTVRVILGGDGPERDKLERMADALGIDCQFLGAVHDPSAIAKTYERIRLSVVPAAAGLTAIQSLAHGVPVVTDDDDYSQMPEAESVIPGVTGSRFRAADVDALADAMEFWLKLPTEEYAEASQRCIEEVRNRWTPQAQAGRMLRAVASVGAVSGKGKHRTLSVGKGRAS